MRAFADVLSLTHGACEIVLCCPTGAGHVERGLPCQDACMASQQFYRGYPCTLLAVADGHGSAAYSRSDIGAHLAVEAVRDAAAPFLRALVELVEKRPHSWRVEAAHLFRSRFGKALWHCWCDRVRRHIRKHDNGEPFGPFSGDSFQVISPLKAASCPADDAGRANSADLYPLHSGSTEPPIAEKKSSASLRPYGTTIALAILFESLLFAGAIGDSTIYTLGQDTVAPEPMFLAQFPTAPAGLTAVGLSTDSLCSAGAPYAWNSTWQTLDLLGQLNMICLTTDGMPDSLLKPLVSVQDLYVKTIDKGLDWLKQVLPQQLQSWSREGVGDDMAVIVCFPFLRPSAAQ